MEIDNRKEQIIKAALKRFSHFGIGKTTMNEIADDSSISKGNIYYYFPDKNALITEVIQHLIGQFDIMLKERIANCTSTLETLEQIQHVKNEFFEKHYMLHIFEGFDCPSLNENTKHLAELSSQYSKKIIVEIFQNGVERKEFKPFNVEETAELYIQASKGIFLVNKDQSVKKITIDEQLRDTIHHKQIELAKIFIKALSHH